MLCFDIYVIKLFTICYIFGRSTMLGEFLKYYFVFISIVDLSYGNTELTSSFPPDHPKNILNTPEEENPSKLGKLESELSTGNGSRQDFTHHPRENVESTFPSNYSTANIKLTHILPETTPVYEIPKKNDGKPSVAKKGVENDIFMKNVTLIDNKPSVAKKGVENDIFMKNVTLINDNTQPTTTVPPIQTSHKSVNAIHTNKHETEGELEHSRNYVLIIAGISVLCLVALLFVGTYKIWSEWWQHRHYKRMDFLIEGMYNN